MANLVPPGGPRTIKCDVDDNDDRSWEVVFLVEADSPVDALFCSELPEIGSPLNELGGLDEFAICTPKRSLKIHKEQEGDNAPIYAITINFSSKASARSCIDNPTGDPLLQPMKRSGSFTKFTEEAKFDRFGEPITSSTMELLRGPQNEWDANRPEVRIEQSVPELQLQMLSALSDTLNASTLWGFPPRTIKFTPGPWEQIYYGTCFCYYKRTLIFEMRFRPIQGVNARPSGTGTALSPEYEGDVETFDRELLDEGAKVIRGRWDKDPGSSTYRAWIVDPAIVRHDDRKASDFIRYKDWNGENARIILNGEGAPADTLVVWGSSTGTGTSTSGEPTGTNKDEVTLGPAKVHVEKYGESEFLLLGIPAELEQCQQLS